MSYAGTYGADETCPCGHYWRSCGKHSIRASSHNRERSTAIEHVQKAEEEGPSIEAVPVTFYDVTCPGCERTWREDTEEEARERFDTHLRTDRKKSEWPVKHDDGWRPFAVRKR